MRTTSTLQIGTIRFIGTGLALLVAGFAAGYAVRAGTGQGEIAISNQSGEAVSGVEVIGQTGPLANGQQRTVQRIGARGYDVRITFGTGQDASVQRVFIAGEDQKSIVVGPGRDVTVR